MPPPSSPRIAITGFGLVTPLGLSAWSTFRALLDGRTLTDRLAGWSPATTPEMQAELVCAAGHVGRVRHAAQDPAIDLAEIAAREALEMAGGDSTGIPCFIGASKGAVHALARAADGARNGRGASNSRVATRPRSSVTPSENALAATLGPVGYLSHHLRQRLNLGPTRGIVAACASGLTALHAARLHLLHDRESGGSGESEGSVPLAARLPVPLVPNFPPSGGQGGESGGSGGERHWQASRQWHRCPSGDGRRVLVVSSEAALLPIFIHSYRRLGVLPLSGDPATYRGRPLDRQRSGFILVEQAAAVVLERQEAPLNEPENRPLALLDTAVASEGFDLVRPAPGMPALEHVARQLLAHGPIDVLHPHATGTLDNDEAELGVYARVLSDAQVKLPDIYACKGAIGHGLGVSGLAALVLACLCARTGRRPPMPWLSAPIDSPLALSCNSKLETRNSKPSSTHALFAAGFGGHVAGAVIG